MQNEVIKEKVSEYSRVNLSFEDQLDALLLFILELDSYNFNKVLNQNIEQKGLENTMNELIYPLLDKLSLAWMAGSFLEVHESFVTQIIKSKILAAIENIKCEPKAHPSYVIYLPPNEKQELSLLYLHYILKDNGCKVINLGNEVNLNDMRYAIETCKPDYVFTILNENITNMPLQNYIDQICEELGESKMLVTGYQTLTAGINWPKEVLVLKNLEETLKFIKNN